MGGSYIFLLYHTKTVPCLPYHKSVGRDNPKYFYFIQAWHGLPRMYHANLIEICIHAPQPYEWEEERWGKGGRAQCPVSGANPSQCIPFQAIPYHNIPSQCIPYQCIPHHTNPGGSLGRIPSSPLMVWYCIFWYRPLQYLWYQTIVVAWY